MDKEFIKDLVEKKAEHIALKKAEIKLTKGSITGIITSSVNKGVVKEEEDVNSIERKIVGNTYMWIDSHSDVHSKSVFAKSIKERKQSIFHLVDHEYKLTAKIGEPKDIYEGEIAWKDLNVDKEGNTTALFMDSEIFKSYNERIFNDYKENKIQQHSVGMQYQDLELAINDEDYEDEYKVWVDIIGKIGNPEVAEEKGYFWYVKQAKLVEISAVLLGSNELTPTVPSKAKPTEDELKTKAILDWLKK